MSALTLRLSLVVVLEALIGVVSFGAFDDRLLAWQAAARYSGRLSLAIYALIVIADAMPRGAAARALSSRPYHVLAFNHVIHLGFLLTYLTLAEHFPPLVRLAGGALGYALIVLMPLLHARYLSGALSSTAFVRLRIAYVSYLGFVMLMTYAARLRSPAQPGAEEIAFGGERSHYIALMAFTVLLLAWRALVGLRPGILARHHVDDSD